MPVKLSISVPDDVAVSFKARKTTPAQWPLVSAGYVRKSVAIVSTPRHTCLGSPCASYT